MASLSALRAFPLQVALLLAGPQMCLATAIAAWQTTIGPQVMLQDPVTADIRYSYCNSYDTPVYSYTDDTNLPLTYPAKNGTNLAGVGWWDSTKTIASIFYLDTQDRIANALMYCNMTTGKFYSSDNIIISTSIPSVHNETGFAALLLGSTLGYRVYYHDKNQSVNQLDYTNSNGWSWGGFVSQDSPSSSAIHAAFSDKNNISVVIPRDSENFEVSRFNTDNTWHISTAPAPLNGTLVTSNTSRSAISVNYSAPINFTMAAWDSKPNSMGISIDSHHTRYAYYIGTDRTLYQMVSLGFVWQYWKNQTRAYWPLADTADASFGITSDFDSSSVQLYYFSNQSLVQVMYNGNDWIPASALATANASSTALPKTTASPTAVSSSTNAPDASAANTGLSSGAKAGIGVGVSIGVIALGLAGLAMLFGKRKAARRAQEQKAAAAAQMENSQQNLPPASEYSSQPVYGPLPAASPWASDYDYKDQNYPQAAYGGLPGAFQAGYQEGYAVPFQGRFQEGFQSAYRPSYPDSPQARSPDIPQQELDSIPAATEMDAAPRIMYELPSHHVTQEHIGSDAGSPVLPPSPSINGQIFQYHHQ